MASLQCSLGGHHLTQQMTSNPIISNNVQPSDHSSLSFPTKSATTLRSLERKENLKYEIKSNKRHPKWRTWYSNDGLTGPVPGPVGPEPVVEFFYAINHKDTQKLDHLLSHNCVFQDLIFYIPFGGKQGIINFLCDVMDAMGASVYLVIDDTLMEGDYLSATVTWHLEWKGKEIPFTSGCSFFEFEQLQGQLFIRKIVGMEELPVKPGELVLKLLKTTRMAFDSFPAAAEGLLEKSHDSSEGLLKFLDMLRAYTKKKTS